MSSEETTAVTSLEALEREHAESHGALTPPCAQCGLRNPSSRRSCLACGAPLGSSEEMGGPLPIDAPLLERHEEAASLDTAVQHFLQTKEGALVAIAAPRGFGATRLVRHAAERLLEPNTVRILSTTVRDADGAYAPLTRLLWERFGVTPAKGPQAARTEIVSEVNRVLASRTGPPTEHARRIVTAAGLPGDPTGKWEAEATRMLPRVAESVGKFLAADAAAQPIAILVDNLDAASDDGIGLFRTVVEAVIKAPVLVIVAGDPATIARLADLAAVNISPGTLSREACAALCHHLLPGLSAVPHELLEAVVTRAEGSPGRVREILLALIESRVVIPDEVPWRIDLDALGPQGPVSSADLFQVRLDRLDPEARGVLARAAVVGEVFWEGTLIAMTRVERADADPFGEDPVQHSVVDALRRLTIAELIAPIEDSELALEREYAFAVRGLRELILQTEDEATLRRRHDVCASWLELAAGPRADDLARAIAGHLEKAGLFDAAARAYLRAARAARQSYRGPQAVQLFNKALSHLAAGDAPTRIDALHDTGVVLSLLGQMDEANATFRAMLDLAFRYGARNKMAAALGRLGRIARGRGEMQEARAHLWRALELFQAAEDVRGVAAVQDDLGIIAYLAGEFDSAIAHSTQALDIRRDLDDPLGEALSTHNLGLVHFARGQPRQARAHFERALALREKFGDVEGTVTTRNVLAALAYDRGDTEQAERMWGEILELAEALGDKRMIVYATHNLGESAIWRGDVTLASQFLDAAELLANEISDRRALAEVERSRGALARLAGDGARARVHLERSLAIAQSTGVKEAEALALRGLGEVCAMTVFDTNSDNARQADDYFTQSTLILEDLGATRELARTRSAYGSYLLERGDVMAGRRVLSMAVPVLERLELAEAVRARQALTNAGGELVIPGQQPG